MTESSGNSQGEGLRSEHDEDPEGRTSGGSGVQDVPPGPLSRPDARGEPAPSELDRSGREAGAVRDGEVLPGLDEGSLERQGLHLELEEQRYHAGPLPSPDALAAYEAVSPGLAERIVRVMERTVLGEEDRRDRALAAGIKTAVRGQAIAALLAVVLVCAAIALMWRGQTAGATILLSLPVVMLVRTFWGGRGSDGAE